jgi:hypothetical protein
MSLIIVFNRGYFDPVISIVVINLLLTVHPVLH